MNDSGRGPRPRVGNTIYLDDNAARVLRTALAGGIFWLMSSDVTHILSAIEEGDPSAALTGQFVLE